MPNPTAAILVIGNEVLSGRTADANINYLARRCTDVGIELRECRVVRDDTDAIVAAVNALRRTHTYLFTTGGIGPTHDDITIASIAKAFGVAVERNLQVESKLKDYYATRVTPATLRMADYPAGARIMWHGENFAPSCIMENVIILAGQPRIMQIMFEATLPNLNTGQPLHTQQIDVWGLESQLAAALEEIQTRHPQVEIGSYPYRVEGNPGTALVCRGVQAAQVQAAFAEVQAMLAEKGFQPRAA